MIAAEGAADATSAASVRRVAGGKRVAPAWPHVLERVEALATRFSSFDETVARLRRERAQRDEEEARRVAEAAAAAERKAAERHANPVLPQHPPAGGAAAAAVAAATAAAAAGRGGSVAMDVSQPVQHRTGLSARVAAAAAIASAAGGSAVASAGGSGERQHALPAAARPQTVPVVEAEGPDEGEPNDQQPGSAVAADAANAQPAPSAAARRPDDNTNPSA